MPSDLQRRTPRHVREAKAFRTLQLGAITGTGFIVTTVLAVLGAIGDSPAILLLILTVILALRFRRLTGLGRRPSR